MADTTPTPTTWRATLSDWEGREVTLCERYAGHYHHGTDGHTRMVLLATLAHLFDAGQTAHVASRLSPRDQAEIAWTFDVEAQFRDHPTDGKERLLLIAKIARMLGLSAVALPEPPLPRRAEDDA